MGWFRTHPGGENNEFDINTDCVEYVEYKIVGDEGGRRTDAVLYMTSGREFVIDPTSWQEICGIIRDAR